MANSKIGGQVAITYEMLNSILCMPEGCKIVEVVNEPLRDIARFKFHADEAKKGVAYQIGESMEYPAISQDTTPYVLRALQIAEDIHKRAAEGDSFAKKMLDKYQVQKESNE